jgi:hypothetical protein
VALKKVALNQEDQQDALLEVRHLELFKEEKNVVTIRESFLVMNSTTIDLCFTTDLGIPLLHGTRVWKEMQFYHASLLGLF